MRRFVTAFVCLSFLAMAQNVVLIEPRPMDPALEMSATSQTRDNPFVPSAALLRQDDAPEPAAMMLLVVGLSGLTAVGGRNHDRKTRCPLSLPRLSRGSPCP